MEREKAKAASGVSTLAQSQGLEGGDADDGSDDGTNNQEAVSEFNTKLSAIAEDGDGSMEDDVPAVPLPPPEPIVDAEGFESVARGKNKKKRAYQI
jgi:hypothetical protein